MTIAIRFFAITRDLAGRSDMMLELPHEATVETAVAELVKRFPALARHVDRMAVAVNLEYVERSRPLQDGEELVLIPPVSGG